MRKVKTAAKPRLLSREEIRWLNARLLARG